MVEGGSDQAYRPGHVPENLIPKKLNETDGAASQLDGADRRRDFIHLHIFGFLGTGLRHAYYA